MIIGVGAIGKRHLQSLIKKNITIILVAHRLNNVKNFDIIFKFEKDELVKHGKFNEIINDKLI